MSTLTVIKLSAGELPRPWIITDDSNAIDKRAGRWTNGGRGWTTKREALEALDEILGERGRGRPSTGVKIQVRIPAEGLARIDRQAEAEGVTRAEMIRRMLEAPGQT